MRIRHKFIASRISKNAAVVCKQKFIIIGQFGHGRHGSSYQAIKSHLSQLGIAATQSVTVHSSPKMPFLVVGLLWAVLALALIVSILNLLPRLLPSQQFAKSLPGPYFLNILKAIPYVYSVTPRMCHDLPRQWAKEYKQTYRIWGIGRLSLEVFKASVMETILASSKHTQKGNVYRILQHFLGDGLLVSNGQKWFHRRRILTPAFHFGILQQFLAVFREEREKLRQVIEETINTGEGVVDLSVTMSSFTLNTICESSMGVKLDSVSGAKEYRRNIYRIGALILERFLKVWLHVPLVYKWSLNRLRMDEALKPVHEFTQRVINKRRDTGIRESTDVSATDNTYERFLITIEAIPVTHCILSDIYVQMMT